MIQILIAVLAGVLTVAAPCILPLLPILLGTSIGQSSKFRPLFIVAGFMLVFSVVAVLISFLAQHLGIDANIFRNIAIVILAMFGVLLIWPEPFDRLMLRFSVFAQKLSARGYSEKKSNLSGFVLGMTLGLVWTPCAGPVLGSILTLIATQSEFLTSTILLLAYALGAGLPMLLIAYGGQFISGKIGIFARYVNMLQRIFGVLIILLAILMYFNYDTQLYSIILQRYPICNVRF